MKKTHTSRLGVLVYVSVMIMLVTIPTFAETEGYGPGFVLSKETEAVEETESSIDVIRGESLGLFSTTGYCNCEICSAGHTLTYSGTVPQAQHTVSADISVYPIGTQLILDDIVYTVEDMGSRVNGNSIDIYYDTHEEAVAHGRIEQEVFAVRVGKITYVPKLIQ